MPTRRDWPQIPDFTSSVTLLSMPLSSSPSTPGQYLVGSSWASRYPPVNSSIFSLPYSRETQPLAWLRASMAAAVARPVARTISRPHLGFYAQSFSYHDGRVRVVLLHRRVGPHQECSARLGLAIVGGSRGRVALQSPRWSDDAPCSRTAGACLAQMEPDLLQALCEDVFPGHGVPR